MRTFFFLLKANCLSSYLTIDNPHNICERVTTTTLQKCDGLMKPCDSLTDVHGCQYMLFDTSWCDPFSGYQLQDYVCK